MDDIDCYHKDADNESCERIVEKLGIKNQKRIENSIESSKVTISTI